MHFSILAALLLPLGALATQVNFYYDNNCQDYAGSASPGLDEVVGGPAGSFSMLWVDATDPCYDTCGPNELFCKNSECTAWDVAAGDFASGNPVCKHFTGGVWAQEVCGCLGCTSECSGEP